MDNDQQYNFPVLAGIFVGGVLWLLYFQFGENFFRGSGYSSSGGGKSWSGNLFSSDCGIVSGSCLASVELKVDGCGRNTAKARIDDALAFPMRTPGCRTIDSELNRRCPAGCSIDSTTMVEISGVLEFTVDEQPDESGECRATGKRQMSVRVNCVK